MEETKQAGSAGPASPLESKQPQASIYSGLQPGPPTDPGQADEGMVEDGLTGPSARPYDVDEHDTHSYQPGERPQEARQLAEQPRETMDESSIKKGPMEEHANSEAPIDHKSTDDLDRKYNDPEAARNDVI